MVKSHASIIALIEKRAIPLNSEEKNKRKIRSFVLRKGRLTKGQQRAMDLHFPRLGLEYDQQLYDFKAIFGRQAPVVLEIGFGMGKSLAEQARDQREHDFIGIEVHNPGVGACLVLAEEYNLENIRVINHDAVEVIEHCIPDHSLERIQIFFPDPCIKSVITSAV